jgi:acetoin utilization protein AcuC
MLGTRDYERIFDRILGWAEAFTAGRVLFTLGGGYSLRSTPRVWALLYLVLNGLPVPKELPPAWVRRWSHVLGPEPPVEFHDPSPLDVDIPNRAEIRHRNLQVARRLLEAARPYWL